MLNASGYVVARRMATVSSKVTGKIAEIYVEEGMEVKKGQVLARLDPVNIAHHADDGASASWKPRDAISRRSKCGSPTRDATSSATKRW